MVFLVAHYKFKDIQIKIEYMAKGAGATDPPPPSYIANKTPSMGRVKGGHSFGIYYFRTEFNPLFNELL